MPRAKKKDMKDPLTNPLYVAVKINDVPIFNMGFREACIEFEKQYFIALIKRYGVMTDVAKAAKIAPLWCRKKLKEHGLQLYLDGVKAEKQARIAALGKFKTIESVGTEYDVVNGELVEVNKQVEELYYVTGKNYDKHHRNMKDKTEDVQTGEEADEE